jgi:hypothetical protein
MTECLHGMEPSWCAICLQHADPRRPEVTGPTIPAGYPGNCRCGCGERYQAETAISYSSEAGGWIITDHGGTA